MKGKLFFITFIALLSMQTMAQDIPNGNFESWEDRGIPAAFGGGSYARPTGGWDCLNSLAPGSCEKVEGRTKDSTAALLTTKKISVPVGDMGDSYSSILMLGDFLTAFTEGSPNFGIPFSDQPCEFSFWYKYIPVSGDKGRVHISFWQGDRKNPKARWRKGITFTKTVNEWTQVVVDLTEYDEDNNKLNFTPTNMCIEITSSLSGMSDHTHPEDLSNVTQEGSQLYITELKFEYASTEAVYTVCGSSAIFGPGPEGWGWDPTDTSNDLTDIGDNNYQLVKSNVALDANTTYEYKVVQDHSWNVNWGIGGLYGENYTFTVPTSGNYNLTFVFNLVSGNCTVDAVNISTPSSLSQVPNGNFADWEDRGIPAAFGGGSYARPTGGWDCLNSLAPGSCEKVEGRTKDSTAALLTTKKISVPVGDMGDSYSSILMLGDFLTAFTEGSPNFGIPFSDQPCEFSFWYKYIPVSGDKGRVHISFWQGDRKNPKARWRKGITFTKTVNEWTQVVVDLTEYDEDNNKLNFTPTNMCIEITSSLSGMSDHTHPEDLSNVTQEGSQLYITELLFADETTGIQNVLSERPASSLRSYNLSGQQVDKTYKGIVIVNGKKVMIK